MSICVVLVMCKLFALFLSDSIIVGYEFPVYNTSESRGSVELCAVLIGHPTGTSRDFVISATTANESASKHEHDLRMLA